MRRSIFQRPARTPPAAAATTSRQGGASAPDQTGRTATAPVAPAIARAFRRAASGVFRQAPLAAPGKTEARATDHQPATIPGDAAVPRGEAIRTDAPPAPRKLSFSRPTAGPETRPETEGDDLFRRRVALQRASNAWSGVIAEWHAAPEATRGPWSLPALMRAIRAEGIELAREAHPGAGGDERVVTAMTRMIAQGVAGEIRSRACLGRSLEDKTPRDVRLSLRALIEEPAAGTQRDPPPERVHVQGASSLIISMTDVASRLLPALAPHAGLGAREVLADAIEAIRQRADELADRALPEGASRRDRQSLFQSLLRREATLMAACLEGLPPAGLASVAHGRTLLDAAFERYREWSKAMAEAVEHAAAMERDTLDAPGDTPTSHP